MGRPMAKLFTQLLVATIASFWAMVIASPLLADELSPSGYGLYKEFSSPVLAFELRTPSAWQNQGRDPDQLLGADKILGIRILATEMSDRQWCRFWTQNISINLAEPVAGDGLQILQAFCDAIPDLSRGDLIQVFSNPAGTRVLANGQEVINRQGTCLNNLLLIALTGNRPAYNGLPDTLLGRTDSEIAARLFHQTEIQPARLGYFAPKPVQPAATGAINEPEQPVIQAAIAESSEPAEPGPGSTDPAMSGIAQTDPTLPTQSASLSLESGVEPTTERVSSTDEAPAQTSSADALRIPVSSDPLSGEGLFDEPGKDREMTQAEEDQGEEAASGETATRFRGEVLATLQGHIHYPQSAIERGQEDQVGLRLQIARSGELVNLEISQPSRYNSLNVEAKRAAWAASPYPAPPEVSGEDEPKDTFVEFPVSFRLTR